MVILVNELKRFQPLEKVILHSLESSLYQVSVLINGIEHMVYRDHSQRLLANSPLHMQSMLDGLSWQQMVIRQSSAYDEMIGLSSSSGDNMLEVPYGHNKLT